MPEAKSGAQGSQVSQRPSKLTGLVKSIGAKVDSAKVATVAKRTGVAIVCTMVAVAVATVVGIMYDVKRLDKLPKAAQTILFWNLVIVGGCIALLCVFGFLAAAAGSGGAAGGLLLS
jgi:hypothetical protein